MMTERLKFASVGAVRKPRDCHVSGATGPAAFDDVIAARLGPVGVAFSDMLVAIANNPPNRIIGNIDAIDLRERAEHVRCLLADMQGYLSVLIADARQSGVTIAVYGDIADAFEAAAESMP
jgi:hypothetical protein